MINNYQKTKDKLQEALDSFDELEEEIKLNRLKVSELIENTSKPLIPEINEEALKAFLDEPYAIIPRKKDEWLVVTPKFIPFNIGFLERSTQAWNYFLVNKYVTWLSDVPTEIQSKFKFKPTLPLSVIDGMLITGKEHQEEAWVRYGKMLTRRDGESRCKIKKGYEFKLIASMIEDGILPFTPSPVDEQDLREPNGKITLRSYQEKALTKFKEMGAIGIFWSFSAGKSFFGAYLCDIIKGKKLVVVPNLTLKEQWQTYIQKYTSASWNTEITTYQGLSKYQNKEFKLIIFDECHTLPAKTFIKGSAIKTKYRVGLSATPYREDGKTSYIFALTGYPVGMDWTDLIDMGVITPPDITLYITTNKEAKLDTLIARTGKTLVFCDSIAHGNRLSKKYGIPFVHGTSKNRIKTIEDNDTVIVSRIADEGLSLKDLSHTIEFDFLFGSRRQEGQRLGRIFHSKGKGDHVILMTPKEFDSYQKRLDAIYEKGFKIRILRG